MAFNAKNAYRGNWGASDLIGADTVALIKNEWKIIGEVVVAADQLIGLGYGGVGTQDAAPGRLFVSLKDADGNAIEGQLRVEIMSSNDMPLGAKPVLIDYDLATTSLGATNRTERLPMAFNNIVLSKDKKFVFKVKNTAAEAQTISRAQSKVEIDVTKQLV